jgi:hypothetical protein
MDPLSQILAGAGIAGSTLEAILKSIQAKQDKEDAKNQMNAQKKYLEANVGDFNFNPEAFSENKYSDVLNPLKERQANTMTGLGNSMALQGLGRSGIGNQLQINALRKGQQDYGNTVTGLARQDENNQYQRAMDAYKLKLAKAEMMAKYQGV